MPCYTASRISLLFSCGIAAALIAACATGPKFGVVPLKRTVELPEFIPEARPRIVVGPLLVDVPQEGTREASNAPRSSDRPMSRELGDALGGSNYFAPLLAPVLVPMIIAAQINEAGARAEQKEFEATYGDRTRPLWELLSATVTRDLDEAVVDAFKAAVGWTSPNLTTEPRWYGEDYDGPTVAIPALVLRITSIQLTQLEKNAGSTTVVMCASTEVIGGAKYRRFETCRHEVWESARFSALEERQAFISKLTAASGRLGRAVAKDIIVN